MKFAKKLESTATELPIEWRPYLLKYKPLKKCINRIVAEMETKGLTAQVGPDAEGSGEAQRVEYMFSGDTGDLHPWLKIAIQSDNESDSSKELLVNNTVLTTKEVNNTQNSEMSEMSTGDEGSNDSRDRQTGNYIYVELNSDVEFFNMLTTDMNNAMTLSQQVRREQFEKDVSNLEKQIALVVSPTNNDMYIWREIFRLYIEKNIFRESIDKSKDKMQAFTHEIQTTKLLKKMQARRSKKALQNFLALNTSLIVFNQFNSVNQTAVTKILKKHDKRSGLHASSEFPMFMQKDLFFSNGMLEMIYKIINTKLVSIIPQLDDYCCPVCYAVAWRPIRLSCEHVFCVRCLIKAQRKGLSRCPVCRAEKAVTNADATNLDIPLQNFMQLYFKREIKEKRKDNEREQAIADCQALTGRRYTGEEACVVM
ncbi:hypothetical protein VKS41_000350 [Umbelopsis sp. WA50703]